MATYFKDNNPELLLVLVKLVLYLAIILSILLKARNDEIFHVSLYIIKNYF